MREENKEQTSTPRLESYLSQKGLLSMGNNSLKFNVLEYN